MLIKSAVTKIGSVDFFAVLPAGFYTFLVIFFSGFSKINPSDASQSLLTHSEPLIKYIQDNPISLLFFFFISYLLGSVISAMKVDWAAKVFPPKQKFPFTKDLKRIEIDLRKSRDITKIDQDKFPVINDNDEIKTNTFNYCKDVIAMESPEAFAYYQTFEARTRYFAGMFWAGVIGILGIFWILIRTGTIFYHFVLEQFIVSVVLILAFGGQLKRVRRSEAQVMLGLYISFLQNRK